MASLRISFLFLITLAVLLAGCSYPPKYDPEFAPVKPTYKPAPLSQNGSLYQPGYVAMSGLYTDRTASQVGDILTIILDENTKADKEAETTTEKTNQIKLENPTILGYTPNVYNKFSFKTDFESDQEFTGKGESSQSNSLSGTISVTVAEVFPNGSLFVKGQKLVTLNKGNEYIKISGIVRRDDITPQNTVRSTQLADARLVYKGDGPVADSNALPWLAKFFISKWWLF